MPSDTLPIAIVAIIILGVVALVTMRGGIVNLDVFKWFKLKVEKKDAPVTVAQPQQGGATAATSSVAAHISHPTGLHLANAASQEIHDYFSKNGTHPHHSLHPFIERKTTELCGYITDAKKGCIKVTTPMLYETIVDSIEKATKVQIVDQDILRWNEIIHPEDRIAFNTFNYSYDILHVIFARGKELKGKRLEYDVRRIFVVDDDDFGVIDKTTGKPLLPEILKAYQGMVEDADADDFLHTSVLRLPTSRTDRHDPLYLERSGLKQHKDFVVAHFQDESAPFMLQELIDYTDRKKASDTESWIRVNDDAARASRFFEQLFPKATPLKKFLENISVAA